MIPTALLGLAEHVKNAAATLGAGGAVVTLYVSAGLPLPATQAFVETKVAAVAVKIDALNASTLELQRQAIVQRKARLRFELGANAALTPKAEPARRVTLERRSAEISDELAELDRDDIELRSRIDKLRQP